MFVMEEHNVCIHIAERAVLPAVNVLYVITFP